MALGFPEYGRLRSVLMHAPGSELDLIGPASYPRYLFEDAIEPAQFRSQHERLIETLRSEGVEVALVEQLLRGSPLLRKASRSPNLTYTRDTVVVTRAGLIRMRMHGEVRRPEPGLVAAALGNLGVRILTDISAPASMEGGDLIFLDGATLLAGVGNRTNRSALRQLWARTRGQGLHTLIAIELPPWTIHLDGTLMIVDRDLAIVHRKSLLGRATVYEEGRPPRRARLLPLLARRGLRFVDVTAYERRRRATNVITLGPRKIIGYAGNARVRKLLSEEGVDVIEVEGSELVRGGGGPRCLTAPIEREGGP